MSKLTQENLDILAGILKGESWEFNSNGNEWRSSNDKDPLVILGNGGKIRLNPWTLSRAIPGFRELIEGEEWHNADLWTKDIEKEGWRPMLEDEIVEENDEVYLSRWEKSTNWKWRQAVSDGYPYRTQRPLPEIKKFIPWGPDDVDPRMQFREKTSDSQHYTYSYANTYCIRLGFGKNLSPSWLGLMNDYLWRFPGEEWKPCHKEA